MCLFHVYTCFFQSVSTNHLLTMAVTVGPILVNTNVYSVLTYIPYHSIAYSKNYIIKHLVFSAQLAPPT